MKTKKEVYLIKGKYYTFTQSYHKVPLCEYGAIEGYAVVDACCAIFPYREFCADVMMYRHNGLWGLFPKIKVLGMGDAEWASSDDAPFTYQAVQTITNGRIDSQYIVAKKEDKWGALEAQKEESLAPISINEKLPFVYATAEEVLSNLKLEKDYIFNCDCIKENLESDVFDDIEHFMKLYDLDGKDTRMLSIIKGEEKYMTDMDTIKAAARNNPYALILIGKELYEDGMKQLDPSYYSLFGRKGPDSSDIQNALKDFCCSEQYFNLSEQYTDSKTILTDIALEYLSKIKAVVKNLSN